MKTLAVVIHARLESTRCPNKHLRDLGDGNTLIDIALQNISKFTNVEEKYLAVYDQELRDRIIDGVEILHREYDSVSKGNAPLGVFYRHLKDVKSDYIVMFNPCQPFLEVEKLQKMIDWFKSCEYESAMSVHQVKNFFWDKDLNAVNFFDRDRLSTTDGPYLYAATHSLVCYSKDYMLNEHNYFPATKDNPRPYVLDFDEIELLDVDTEEDLEIVKSVYEKI
jgi:spore coat polysaccharide biosynthesis protein SpsF (cytidylyltransferase family)